MTTRPPISRAQYEAQLRATPEVAELLDRGWRIIVPCACDYEGCEGWCLERTPAWDAYINRITLAYQHGAKP